MEKFMKVAISQAKKAFLLDEVPVGAVIVKDGKIISKAYNKRNQSKIATHHAEILAIQRACKKLGDWRLVDCDIYVSLEPCPMCAGAIANARIKTLIFGAYDNSGANKNLVKEILSDTRLNHNTKIVGGVLEENCKALLTNFFKKKR